MVIISLCLGSQTWETSHPTLPDATAGVERTFQAREASYGHILDSLLGYNQVARC